MKRSRHVILLTIIAIAIAACDSNETPTPDDNNKLTYMPLKEGNYWVFENWMINPDGTENHLSRIDSIVIVRDTIIRNEKYFILEGTLYPSINEWGIVSILRDSLTYLVNEKGEIQFAQNHFNEILHSYEITNDDGIIMVRVDYSMQKTPVQISLPAGNFESLNYQAFIRSYMAGPDPVTFELDNLYAENIGRVIRTTMFLTSQQKIENRLIRYHINSDE